MHFFWQRIKRDCQDRKKRWCWFVKTVTGATGFGDISKIFGAITKEPSLSEEEKEILLKELEQDMIEMQEVTKRWQSDMASDSWLSKNIRPLSLVFLTGCLFLYIILNSSISYFTIKEE